MWRKLKLWGKIIMTMGPAEYLQGFGVLACKVKPELETLIYVALRITRSNRCEAHHIQCFREIEKLNQVCTINPRHNNPSKPLNLHSGTQGPTSAPPRHHLTGVGV